MAEYVYALTCPKSGDIKYVGMTRQKGGPEARYKQHVIAARRHEKLRYYYPVYNWLASLTTPPGLEILWTGLTGGRETELFFIKLLGKQLLNKGGGTPKGSKMHENTKEALRRALTGRVVSPDTRAKLSASNKGKPHKLPPRTAEHQTKLNEAHRGQKKSEEARRNMSLAHKGIPWSEARRAAQERRA